MKSKAKSLRSQLGQVRALGSAKGGTEHWWMQRLTAIALVPLSIFVIAAFFINVVHGGYEGAISWLHNPVYATFVILFLGAGLHHAVNGLQVVIEDYIHSEFAKLFSIVVVKFIAVALTVLGVLAVVKVLFGV